MNLLFYEINLKIPLETSLTNHDMIPLYDLSPPQKADFSKNTSFCSPACPLSEYV